MVILPRTVRVRYSLSDAEYFQNRDARMDYSWVVVDRSYLSGEDFRDNTGQFSQDRKR